MECFDREETIPDGGQGIGFLNVYRRMRLFYGQEAVFTVREYGRGRNGNQDGRYRWEADEYVSCFLGTMSRGL